MLCQFVDWPITHKRKMNLNYKDIFSERGAKYNRAMTLFPDARKNEFTELFRYFPLKKEEVILDVPSGGGYLSRFFSNEIIPLEFTENFNKKTRVVNCYEDWKIRSVDRLVCLAALHHIEDINLFLKSAIKSVKKGGLIHLADVSFESSIRKFLDGYVNLRTPGGHKGYYRDWKNVVWPEELKLLNIETRKCHWNFSDLKCMEEFCRLLFGIQNDSPGELLKTLKSIIGIGGNSLQWELCYVDLELQ